MMITICGKPGSGKSTVARYLAERLHYKFVSVGNEARKIAKKMNISVLELSRLAEKDEKIDKLIDSTHLKYKNISRIVMDSRVAFYFFPKSLKIYLNVRPEVAARRILGAKRPTERVKNFKETLKQVKERIVFEQRRYKKYYNVDIYDVKNYDVIIDTSNLGLDEMDCLVEKVVRKFI